MNEWMMYSELPKAVSNFRAVQNHDNALLSITLELYLSIPIYTYLYLGISYSKL